MSDSSEKTRRKWINLGEFIAVLALIVSAVGVWVSWKSSDGGDKPAVLVEQHKAVPLVLRGRAASGGKAIEISPVDPGHALESLTLTIKGAQPIELGSDGQLAASEVEAAIPDRDKQPKDKVLSIPVKVEAQYVEGGNERRYSGSYTLRYRWEGGGLFGGRSLRLVSFGRG